MNRCGTRTANIGIDVHRAARIAAAAHGGQIVLSEATRALVQTGLPDDAQLCDLGWHRLKDLPHPERIYQLVAAGIDTEFPPLKSLGARVNLPVFPTPLVGRGPQVGQVRTCVLEPDVRLVTLTGAGGSGKTRIAVAVAASLDQVFTHGVFLVPLAAVTDAEIIWTAIADAVGAGGDGPAAEVVTKHLAEHHALVVLDNLEHLSESSIVVDALLAAAPRLSVVATSRRPLHLRGERQHPVPPLALPPLVGGEMTEVAASAAVQLFVQHAAMVRPGFTLTPENAAAVAAICTRLDGLPLAIELAAARVKLLAPRALLSRLDHRLGLAAQDADRPARQQTLRSTIAWSHDLLTPEQQRVFRRTGVFAGGCDLDALTSVVLGDDDAANPADPLDKIGELLDVSLVNVSEGADGEPLVAMLETIREFALERLAEAGELDSIRRRHAEHYADFAERVTPELRGTHQLVWFDRLEAEHDNLRAALTWSLQPPDPQPARDGRGSAAADRLSLGLRLVNALSWFWYGHGHAAHGRRWLERAVDLASGQDGPDVARALHGLGVLLLQQGENLEGKAALERSLAVWRSVGDEERVAQELSSLGVSHRLLGDPDSARPLLAESIAIARKIGVAHRFSTALGNLAVVEMDAGWPDRAMSLLDEALDVDRALADSWGMAVDQGNRAGALLLSGQPEAAQSLLCSIVDDVLGLGDIELLADTLERFAAVAAERGGAVRAARLTGAADRIREQAGMPLSAPDRALLERSLGPARADVGREAWQREWGAGRGLNHAEAAALAVQTPEEPRPRPRN